MKILYESPNVTVAHDPYANQQGFEIVDNVRHTWVFLSGRWAACLARRIAEWEVRAPTQIEVEEVLCLYANLANDPILIH